MLPNDAYAARAEKLIASYKALCQCTRQSMFPEIDFTYYRYPDFTTWEKWQSGLYKFFTWPLLEPQKGPARMLAAFVWFVIMSLWAKFWQWTLEPNTTMTTGPTPVPVVSAIDYVVLVVIIIGMLLTVVPYILSILFFSAKKITAKAKWLWVGLFLALTAYLLIADWELIEGAMHTNIPALVFAIVAFLLPIAILLTFFSLSMGYFLLPLIARIFDGYVFIHQTLPLHIIRKLLFEEIQGDKVCFALKDLASTELASLKAWAQHGFDSAEKRLMPTTVILALLAVLLTTAPFQTAITQSVTLFSGQFSKWFGGKLFELSPNEMLAFLFIFAFLSFVLAIGIGFAIFLFLEIAVQSAILQAITVAEYAKQQEMKEVAKSQERKNSTVSFLEGFFGSLTEFLIGKR